MAFKVSKFLEFKYSELDISRLDELGYYAKSHKDGVLITSNDVYNDGNLYFTTCVDETCDKWIAIDPEGFAPDYCANHYID